ncbi:UNVERIFIED_ORG: hypothetical protein J3D59_004189 [Pseudomonas fluorescens]
MTGYLDTIPHPWNRNHIMAAMTQNFAEVKPSIDRTPGGKIWNDLKELDDTVWIFYTSISELIDEICIFGERSKNADFWNSMNEKTADHYTREVKRKLYYCTSSLMTLVEVARNFDTRHEIDGTGTKRTEIFNTPGLHNFLQDLRNFSTHWRIAKANWSINFDMEKFTRTAHFVIPKNDLLEWSKWSPNAKQFIQDLDENVDVYEILTKYKKQAQKYYAWHKGAVIVQRAQELQQYFEYTKIHEGIRQYQKWNMILSHVKADINPFEYLARFLTTSQIETVLSYPRNSEVQVDALIRAVDTYQICDNNMKAKLMEVFSVVPPPTTVNT